MALLEQDYKKELDLLKVTLPDVSRIPAVRFDEAKRLVSEDVYKRQAYILPDSQPNCHPLLCGGL